MRMQLNLSLIWHMLQLVTWFNLYSFVFLQYSHIFKNPIFLIRCQFWKITKSKMPHLLNFSRQSWKVETRLFENILALAKQIGIIVYQIFRLFFPCKRLFIWPSWISYHLITGIDWVGGPDGPCDNIRYWPSVKSRWLDIGPDLFFQLTRKGSQLQRRIWAI